MSNRIVLITGAAGGVGLATAKKFVASGYRVVMADSNSPLLQQSAAALSRNSTVAVAVDLRNEDTPAILEEAARQRWGEAVSVLVNNAGISPKYKGKSPGLLDTSKQQWDDILCVNLYSVFTMCRQFVPGMQAQRWGRIINISSMAAQTKSLIAGTAYMASKSGVLGLTRSIASQFAADGITCNVICPGRIDTPMAQSSTTEDNERYLQQIPVRRFGRPEEVAHAIFHLAAEEAGFTTGTVTNINGGFFMA